MIPGADQQVDSGCCHRNPWHSRLPLGYPGERRRCNARRGLDVVVIGRSCSPSGPLRTPAAPRKWWSDKSGQNSGRNAQLPVARPPEVAGGGLDPAGENENNCVCRCADMLACCSCSCIQFPRGCWVKHLCPSFHGKSMPLAKFCAPHARDWTKISTDFPGRLTTKARCKVDIQKSNSGTLSSSADHQPQIAAFSCGSVDL